jgi:hypothetical protein
MNDGKNEGKEFSRVARRPCANDWENALLHCTQPQNCLVKQSCDLTRVGLTEREKALPTKTNQTRPFFSSRAETHFEKKGPREN